MRQDHTEDALNGREPGSATDRTQPHPTPLPTPSMAQVLSPAAGLDTTRWAAQAADKPQLPWLLSSELPLMNRFLLMSGILLLSIGGVRLTVPPLLASVSAMVRPYTATGKQEACLTHLHALALAMSVYVQDNDGRFPALDYGTRTGRVTWVSVLKGYATADSFTCPLKAVPDDKLSTISSYGLNPVLPGMRRSRIEDTAYTLLLADRGDAHDVSLLPPFPSWPATPQQTANLDFRHSGATDVVYSDGHTESKAAQQATGWLTTDRTWGSEALIQTASDRLFKQFPALAQVMPVLAKGHEREAFKLLQAKRQPLHVGTEQFMALQKLNLNENEEQEKACWRLASLWSSVGDKSFEKQIEQEQDKRSAQELQATQSSPWQDYRSDWGFSIQYPQNWKVSTEVDGRYQNTYFRAGPYTSVLIEKGTRTTMGSNAPVAWQGMESDFKQRYGKDYKRIEMSIGRLGIEEASRWIFEIKKPDGPRLRKLYLGRSHAWDSYVVDCTAPTVEFEKWQPRFEHIMARFQF
ncbi:MAG: hypothetical protein JOZ57_05135 [Abitibacteriaceae bacterium]|nr:hypothetical protein [Abditibacteriaceae bacterium]